MDNPISKLIERIKEVNEILVPHSEKGKFTHPYCLSELLQPPFTTADNFYMYTRYYMCIVSGRQGVCLA